MDIVPINLNGNAKDKGKNKFNEFFKKIFNIKGEM
jgi:hypothetical protein